MEQRLREEFRELLRTGKLTLLCEDLDSVARTIVKCTNTKACSSYTILRAMEWLNTMLEILMTEL